MTFFYLLPFAENAVFPKSRMLRGLGQCKVLQVPSKNAAKIWRKPRHGPGNVHSKALREAAELSISLTTRDCLFVQRREEFLASLHVRILCDYVCVCVLYLTDRQNISKYAEALAKKLVI